MTKTYFSEEMLMKKDNDGRHKKCTQEVEMRAFRYNYTVSNLGSVVSKFLDCKTVLEFFAEK